MDETTVAVGASWTVLLWLPAIWVFWDVEDPSERLWAHGGALVVVAVPVIVVSLIGFKLSAALLLLMLFMSVVC